MDFQPHRTLPPQRARAFTLVEMLVVIVIMSILMTVGAIGLGGLGGKGVSSGVASAESIFDEARSIAVGQRTRTRVLVAKDLQNAESENLRRILIVSAELNPTTGKEKVPESWVIQGRPLLLPDQVYFSQKYSVKDQAAGTGALEEESLSSGVKATFVGDYYSYEFNSEGICHLMPGASFVLGTGSRPLNSPKEEPRVTSAAKRDFGGFVVWRNGRTSLFRSPTQISSGITSLSTGDKF